MKVYKLPRGIVIRKVPVRTKKLETNKIFGKISKLGYKRYADYLASPHWKNFKRKFYRIPRIRRLRKQYGNIVCELCKKPDVLLMLHHVTYVNLGRERFEDIVLVCDDCHKAAHLIYENTPNAVSLKDATAHVPFFNQGKPFISKEEPIEQEIPTTKWFRKRLREKSKIKELKDLNKNSRFGRMNIGEGFRRITKLEVVESVNEIQLIYVPPVKKKRVQKI